MNKKVSRGLGFIAFNIVFWSVFCLLIIDSRNSYKGIATVSADIAKLQKEMDELKERKKIIESNIAKFSEEEKLERIARDRLDLSKEGEITLRIVK